MDLPHSVWKFYHCDDIVKKPTMKLYLHGLYSFLFIRLFLAVSKDEGNFAED
jgi:hypothetical protein